MRPPRIAQVAKPAICVVFQLVVRVGVTAVIERLWDSKGNLKDKYFPS
jgi:hypothetical protein